MGKINVDYSISYREMGETFSDRSKDMDLLDIILKINDDKEYIYDFIRSEKVKTLIQSIKNRFRFNKDEAEDCIIFVITEYFYENVITISEFPDYEDHFLNRFGEEINCKVKQMMRDGYSGKEIPSSGTYLYQNKSFDYFDELINSNTDLRNALSKLSLKEQEVIELRFNNRETEIMIAKIMNLSQSYVSELLNRTCEKLKKYL
jgi:RNA polymerase sigma factor (sigma-70 family)